MDARSKSVIHADDRVMPLTRIVAACVVPFLVVAFLPLYLRPDLTGTHFTWRVAPTFTAFWMGSGYLGGAWFFFNVARGRRWHEVSLGFLPVTAFVWVMLGATILHWDRFDIQHVPFWLWLILYAATPFIVPGLWLWNRRRDPRRPVPGETLVPGGVRAALGVVGVVLCVTAVWMFLAPQQAIQAWSWKLTPLTARVMAGWLSLSGVGGLVLAGETRWSAWRVLIQSMLLWLTLLSVGVVRAWSEFDIGRPGVVAVYAVPSSLLGLAVLYAWFERRPEANR